MTSEVPRRERPISILDAVELFAARDMRSGDDGRSAKDRARKFIKTRVKNGTLLSPDGGNSFLLGDFVAWARSLTRNGESWEDKFKGFPANIELSFTTAEPVYAAEGSITAFIVQPTVDAPQEWVDALEKANRKWADTQKENDMLRAEIERLRPLAERMEKIIENNRNAAKKPRQRAVEK